MSPSLWLFGFFALFSGWAFLSLLGHERQRRENEISRKASDSGQPTPPAK